MQLQRLVSSPGLFRFFLAYVVVVDHFTPLQLGSAAVYLFFMLSGYWVTELWNKEYARSAAPYLTFMLSRIWRLLPVYYVSLLALLLVNYAFHTGGRIWLQATTGAEAMHFCLSQLFILGYATLPEAGKLIKPVWSLDIELQFYLIAPVLIALVAKFGRYSAMRIALYALAFGGLVVLAVFYRTNAQAAFLPMYLPFFLIGVVSAQHAWRPNERLAIGGAALAATFVAVCTLVPATRPLLMYGKLHGALSDYNTDFNIVLALLAAAYAMATVRRDPARGTAFARIDRDLSNLSYEIYLLHVSALSLVIRLSHEASGSERVPAVLASWVGLFLVSLAVYYGIDRPLNRMRIDWLRSRGAEIPAPVMESGGSGRFRSA